MKDTLQDLYNEIFDEASLKFKNYRSRPKGQMLTAQDSFDYWLVMTAYKKGLSQGYKEGFADGKEDIE